MTQLNRTVPPRTILISLVAVCGLTSIAGAGILASAGNPSNGHRYHLLSESSWTEAEAMAQSLGGHLVTIDDEDENNWVFDTFATFGGVNRSLWIGLNDQDAEGSFVWAGGTPVGYTNWGSGEPSDDPQSGGADHTHIRPPNDPNARLWNDIPDAGPPNHPTITTLNGVVELTMCNPADLAPPFGLLDLADINAFTTGFVAMDPIADLDGNSLLDLTDIGLFITSFTAGCP